METSLNLKHSQAKSLGKISSTGLAVRKSETLLLKKQQKTSREVLREGRKRPTALSALVPDGSPANEPDSELAPVDTGFRPGEEAAELGT